MKVSNQASFGLDINTLSLTQPCHVIARPELTSLVQEDLVAVREVVVTITVGLSYSIRNKLFKHVILITMMNRPKLK